MNQSTLKDNFRAGLKPIDSKTSSLQRVKLLTGLSDNCIRECPRIPHSIVRACDDVLADHEYRNALLDVQPGGSIVLLGPDIPEIGMVLSLTKSNAMVYESVIAVYDDRGSDPYDMNRFNLVDQNPLHAARWKCHLTQTSVRIGVVTFCPVSLLKSTIRTHPKHITMMASRNAGVSKSVLDRIDDLELCLRRNLVLSKTVLPALVELMPSPEDLKHVTREPRFHSNLGYKIQLAVKDDLLGSYQTTIIPGIQKNRTTIAFTPCDDPSDLEKVYYEDYNNWIETERDYWLGSKIAGVVTTLGRAGVMVARKITLVFEGIIRSTVHERKHLITLPTIDRAAHLYFTYDLVTVDYVQMLKAARMLMTNGKEVDIFSMTIKDIQTAAAAYDQVMAHVRQVLGANSLTPDEIYRSSNESANILRAACSYIYYRNLQLKCPTLLERFTEWFRTVAGDISSEDYNRWMANDDLSKFSLALPGFNSESRVPENHYHKLLNLTGGSCLVDFYSNMGLALPPHLLDASVSKLHERMPAFNAGLANFNYHATMMDPIDYVDTVADNKSLNDTIIVVEFENSYHIEVNKINKKLSDVDNSIRVLFNRGHNLQNHVMQGLADPYNPFNHQFHIMMADLEVVIEDFLLGPHEGMPMIDYVELTGIGDKVEHFRYYEKSCVKNAVFEVAHMDEAIALNLPFLYIGCGVPGAERVLNYGAENGLRVLFLIDLVIEPSIIQLAQQLVTDDFEVYTCSTAEDYMAGNFTKIRTRNKIITAYAPADLPPVVIQSINNNVDCRRLEAASFEYYRKWYASQSRVAVAALRNLGYRQDSPPRGQIIRFDRCDRSFNANVFYNFNSKFPLGRTEYLGIVIDREEWRINVTDMNGYGRYMAALQPANMPIVRDEVNVYRLPVRLPIQTDEQYNSVVGEYVMDKVNNGIVVANPLPPLVAGGWICYDDAYSSKTGDSPFSDIHRLAHSFSKKLTIEDYPEKISIAPGLKLYATPTGASHEWRVTKGIMPHHFRWLDVDTFGAPIHESWATGVKTYDFKGLMEAYSNAPINECLCGHELCGVHTLFEESGSEYLRDMAKVHVQHYRGETLPSRLNQYLPSKMSKALCSRFRHIESKRLVPIDYSIFNLEVTQKYIFNKDRLRNPDFRYEVAGDPFYNLDQEGRILAINAVAGAGKTQLIRNRRYIYIAPYKNVKDENKGHFEACYTFETGVGKLINYDQDLPEGAEKCAGIVLDECQAMGPLILFYLDWAWKRGIKVFVMGDDTQVPWSFMGQTTAEDAKTFPDKQLEWLFNPARIFDVTQEYNAFSQRIGPIAAALASKLVGRKIYGMNPRNDIKIMVAPTLTDALKIKLDDKDAVVMGLTQDVKTILTQHYPGKICCTAAEAGGMNAPRAIVYLLPAVSPLPMCRYIDNTQVYSHAYVAVTRGPGVVFVPPGFMGLERNQLSEMGTNTLKELEVKLQPRCALKDGKRVAGFTAETWIVSPIHRIRGNIRRGLIAARPDLVIKMDDEDGFADVRVTENIPKDGKMTFMVDPTMKEIRSQLHQTGISSGEKFIRTQEIKEMINVRRDKLVHVPKVEMIKYNLPYSGNYTQLDTQAIKMLVSDAVAFSLPDDRAQPERIYGMTLNEIQGSHLRVGDLSGTATAEALFITLGTSNPSFVQYTSALTTDVYQEYSYLDPNNEVAPIYNSYIPMYSTGQFFEHHAQIAQAIISSRYEAADADGQGVILIGHPFDFAQAMASFKGKYARLELQKVFDVRPDEHVKMFLTAPVCKFQRNHAFTQASCAIKRYGQLNYQARLAQLTPSQQVKLVNDFNADYKSIAKIASEELFIKNYWTTDILDRLINHHVGFLCDQVNKGSLLRPPNIQDLYGRHNMFQHLMKVQEKNPDEFKIGWLYSDKVGQPIQVGSSAWIHIIAGYFRLINELIQNAFGPRLRFMGPNFTLERVHAELKEHIEWGNLWGIDVSECDASHIPTFMSFVQELLTLCYPNLDRTFLNTTFAFLSAFMVEWFCRTRDGCASATVLGQLASGSPWTFLWNCLWSMFQTFVMISEITGALRLYLSKFVGAYAGDDGKFSIKGLRLQLPTQTYVTKFHVILKVSFEPYAVIFCHHTFTEHGVFVDPFRLIGKFFGKPINGDVKEIEEMQQAIHILIRRYRDPGRFELLCQARAHRFGDSVSQTAEALDLLFRFTNTPASKLQKLLKNVTLRAAHF